MTRRLTSPALALLAAFLVCCAPAFTLPNAAQAAPAANDAFANAQQISLRGAVVYASLSEASAETGEPAHGEGAASHSVWYTFTAAATSSVTLIGCNSSGMPLSVALYSGGALGSLTPVARGALTDCSVAAPVLTATLRTGVRYSMAIDAPSNVSSAISVPFLFSGAYERINDERHTARTLSFFGAAPVVAGNDGATAATGEPDHADQTGGHSVWYRLDVERGVPVTIDVCDADFDTLLAVYEHGYGGYNEVTSSDNDPAVCGAGSTGSFVRFTPVTTGSVHIAIDGKNGATGVFSIAVRRNQTMARPLSIVANAPLMLSNRGAQTDPGEIGNETWYAVSAALGELVTIDTCSPLPGNLDTVLRVFTSGYGGMSEVGTSDNELGCGNNGSRVVFRATSSTTLIFSVAGVGGATGRFPLKVSTSPRNDDIDYALPLTASANGSMSGTNVRATVGPGEPEHAPGAGASVWYTWASSATPTRGLSVCSTTFTPVLAVYRKSGTALNKLASAVGTGSGSERCAAVTVSASAGEVLHVAVAGASGATGSFTVSLPPEHDAFATPRPFTSYDYGDTRLASREAGEPDHAGKAAAHSLWYRYEVTPSAARRQGLSACTSLASAKVRIAVYSGSDLASLQSVGTTTAGSECSGNGNGAGVVWRAPASSATLTYYVAVDSVDGEAGQFWLSTLYTPSNDDADSASDLSSDLRWGTSIYGGFGGATLEDGERTHAGVSAVASLWYEFTPYRTEPVQFDTCGKSYSSGVDSDTAIAVYTGTGVNAGLTQVAAAADTAGCGAAGKGARVSFTATAGTTYRIAVVTADVARPGFVLRGVSRPYHDNVSSDISLYGIEVTYGATDLATAESDEPDHAGSVPSHSVWYRWRADFTGPVTYDTCAEGGYLLALRFDTVLAVYTRTSGGDLTPVVSNDDTPGCGPDGSGSSVAFRAIANTTYYVAVDGKGGAAGDYVLSRTPDHDGFEAASKRSWDWSDSRGFSRATAESGEPAHGGEAAAHSVWYDWTPAFAGVKIVETCRSYSTDARIAVYTGSTLASLQSVAALPGSACPEGKYGTKIRFRAEANTSYKIAVDSASGSYGEYSARSAPPSDDRSGAIDLGGTTNANNTIYNAADASIEVDEPDHADAGNPVSIWLKWTPTYTASAVLDTCRTSGTAGAAIGVYTQSGSNMAGLRQVTSTKASDGCASGTQARARWRAVSGTEYWLAIAAPATITSGLEYSLVQGPRNDDLAAASSLYRWTTTGTSWAAGPQDGEPRHDGGAGASTWWRFDTAAGQAATVFACAADSSMPVPTLALYSGPADAPTFGELTGRGAARTERRCRAVDVPRLGGRFYAAVDSPTAFPSTSYSVYVAYAPSNDDLQAAALFSGSTGGTLVAASAEDDEVDHHDQGARRSVWYRWTAPTTGSTALEACADDFTPRLAAYTQAEDGKLSKVASAGGTAVAGEACGAANSARARFAATAGTTYLVAVDMVDGLPGTFSLNTSPPHDDLVNRAVLWGGESDYRFGTTALASSQSSEPAHAGTVAQRSAWYEWTPNRTAWATIGTCLASPAATRVAVYTGAELASLAPVASSRQIAGCADGRGARVRARVTEGTTYVIAVDSAIATTFTIQVALAPQNDELADAQSVSVGDTLSGSTEFATAEPGEPAHDGTAAEASVWFKYAAATSRAVTLKACGSSFDAVIRVYDATGRSPQAVVDRSARGCGSATKRVALRFEATAGQTYAIALDGKAGVAGSYFVQFGTPANDDIEDAATIPAAGGSGSTSTGTATTQDAEPRNSYPYGSTSVWWRWTPAVTGSVELNTCGPQTPWNSTIDVFTGSAAALTAVPTTGSTRSGCGSGYRTNLAATAGTTYLVRVSASSTTQEARLQIKPPANDRYVSPTTIVDENPVDGTTAGASNEDYESQIDGGAGRSIWYAWTARERGVVTIDTCGSPTPAITRLFTGSTLYGASAVSLEADPGACPDGEPGAKIAAAVEADTEYRIALDSADDRPAGPTRVRVRLATDTTPPTTTFTDGPPAQTNSASQTFSFETGEPDSTYACRFDAEDFAPCNSPVERWGLPEGPHVFEVRATDRADNTEEPPARRTFTIDRTAPEITFDEAPREYSSAVDSRIRFSANESATFTCSLDGADPESCDATASRADLPEGTHTWSVVATDVAGNTASKSANFTIDRTPPTTTLGGEPATRTNGNPPRVTFSSEDGATFRCAVDRGTSTDCTSPFELTGLGEGEHHVAVRATDRAGNPEQAPTERSFTIDRTAPETTLDAGPEGTITTREATFEFSSEADAEFRCSVDGERATPCSSPLNLRLYRRGDHEFTVAAVDSAGNADPTPARRSFTNAPPVEAPDGTLRLDRTVGFTGLTVKATLAATSPEPDPIPYSINFGDGSDPVAGSLPIDSPVEHTYDRAGTFQVRVVYGTGDASTDAVDHITVVAREDVQASAGEDVTGQTNADVTLDGSASRPSALIGAYTWDFGDGTSGTGMTVNHRYAEPGTYTATLTTTVAGETDTDTMTVRIAAPKPAAKVHVRSAGGPLAGAAVVYISPRGVRQSSTTDQDGTATIEQLPDGRVAVYAYADGYQPKSVSIDVSGGAGEATVELRSGAAGAATLDAKRMTYDEIIAAGIDVADPANSHVYEARVNLYFEPIRDEGDHVPVDLYITPGGIVCRYVGCGGAGGGCGNGCGGGGGGGGPSGGTSCTAANGVPCILAGGNRYYPSVDYVEGKPIIHWLVLPMRASFLKEFFQVKMIVHNVLEGLSFSPGKASLQVPSGLSLAPLPKPQTAVQSMAAIPGGQSRTASWIVRGDIEGEYDLTADYAATIDPLDLPVHLVAKTKTPLKVWAGSALRTKIKLDRYGRHWGAYGFDVVVENRSDTPIYNMQIEMFDRPPGEPDTNALFFYAPGTQQVQGQDVIEPCTRPTDDAGNELPCPTFKASFVVFAGIGNEENPNLELKLDRSFVQRTGGDVDLAPKLEYRERSAWTPNAGPVSIKLDRGAVDRAVLEWNTPATDVPVKDFTIFTRQSLRGGQWHEFKTVPKVSAGRPSLSIPSTERAEGRHYAVRTNLTNGDHLFVHELGIGKQVARYVALGDSYSSGEGVPRFELGTAIDVEDVPVDLRERYPLRNKCHRSEQGAYGPIVAADPDVPMVLEPFRFAACSGAIARDIVDPNVKNEGEPAQWDHVSQFTDVISLSMGGNDIGFRDIAILCIVVSCGPTEVSKFIGSNEFLNEMANAWKTNSFFGRKLAEIFLVGESGCKPVNLVGAAMCAYKSEKVIEDVSEMLEYDLERETSPRYLYSGQLQERLVKVYKALHERAPNATIVVQQYPKVLDNTGPNEVCSLAPGTAGFSLTGYDRAQINGVIERLNTEIREAVAEAAGGAKYLKLANAPEFTGHELCRGGTLNSATYLNSVVFPVLDRPENTGPLSYSVHPNAGGQRAYADALRDALNGVTSGVVNVFPAQEYSASSVLVPRGARVIRASTASAPRGIARAAAERSIAAASGPPVTLKVVAPNGTIYTTSTIGVRATSTSEGETIEIDNPAEGTWKIFVVGASDASADGVPTQVGTEVTTDDPPAATVKATAKRVSGSARTYDLSADGTADGTYRWTLSDGTFATGKTVRHAFTGDGAMWASVVLDVERGNDPSASADIGEADVTAPQPVVEKPASGPTNAGSLTLSGTAGIQGADGAKTADLETVKVLLYAGPDATGSPQLTLTAKRSATGAWHVPVAAALADGTWTARAEQFDDAGNLGRSAPRTFKVDTVAPSIKITTPTDGSASPESVPSFAGTAGAQDGTGPSQSADDAKVTVTVFAGTAESGAPLRTVDAIRAGTSWSVRLAAAAALPDGTYTAVATQRDAAGNSGRASSTFSVDSAAPFVALTAPTEGADLADPTPDIDGTVSPTARSAVEVRVKAAAGAVAWSGTAQQAGGAFSISTGALADGSYTVTATAQSATGVPATSAPRAFRVDTVGPKPTIGLALDGGVTQDVTPALSGQAGDLPGDQVALTVLIWQGPSAGGTPTHTLETARAGGAWSLDAPELAPGTWTVEVRQRDRAGNNGAATLTFNVAATSTGGGGGATPGGGTPGGGEAGGGAGAGGPGGGGSENGGSGGGGSGGASGGGSAPQSDVVQPPDLVKPIVSAVIPKPKDLRKQLRKQSRLTIEVRSGEPGRAVSQLLLPAKDAKRWKFKGKPIDLTVRGKTSSYLVLSKATQAVSGTAAAKLTLALDGRSKKALAKVRSLKLAVWTVVTDAAGNAGETVSTVKP